ncbi:probable insulin-like peptide 3 isoform X1 [Drosophila virilis]|uniref:Uncharacterized protein, isoform A n=1 Tax=Drosophila virilis TaxID=7244 RepID=B4LG98_DROVI|nr:probable insulin-like peptide 3 isoform X1 [Drosophila virilis]EDW69406.1 uncharacterized protein Dvir_GJ13218, isoform A [Drosophila virilis]
MGFECSKLQGLVCSMALLLLLVLHVQSMRLCGTELPEMLEQMCTYGYNTKLKRSYVGPAFNSIDNANSDASVDLDLGSYAELDLHSQPLLRALLGESGHHLVKTRRRRYGVHDECCRKSCSLEELNYYCKKPENS